MVIRGCQVVELLWFQNRLYCGDELILRVVYSPESMATENAGEYSVRIRQSLQTTG